MDGGVVFVGVVLMIYMIVSTWWMSGLSNRIEDMELRSNFINSVDEKIKEMREDIDDVFDDVRDFLDVNKRNDEARAKLMACALADRIDALSARMDAVELACGLREKAKTMGGQDG
jgi:hypothetical protein